MPDHRKHPRKPVRLPVAFRIGEGPRIEAVCRDLSLGGMFIETASPPPFGETVVVLLSLAALKPAAKIESTVRWSVSDGMGVQFGAMGARETHALIRLLDST